MEKKKLTRFEREYFKERKEDQDIKAFIRGHLISIDCKPKILENEVDEFYVTKYWNIIVSLSYISFKRNKKQHKFNFVDIKKIFLKDSCILVFDDIKTRKRFYIKLVL